MGFDVVGVVNGIWQSQYGVHGILLGLFLFALWSSGFFGRLFRIIEEMMFKNWQLALLGSTAVALSLASGYTTFDGLRNFTSAPLLSILIAFGIQGVMLIVAWLIGESFATGMNQRIPGSTGANRSQAVVGMALGVALVGLVFYWTLGRFDAVGFRKVAGAIQGFRADWERFADVALYFAIALLIVAIIAFNSRRGGDISGPYAQSMRIIARNAVLWVMFLASMGASVFFSFDSHFNAIFPVEQRARAAEIRTLNQISGVVADIGERAQKVQIAEAERLFETEGWKAYDAVLSRLARESQGSQAEIEQYFVKKMEDRRRGIVEQQERIAGAERGQTALLRKRDELEAELQRIEPAIGALEAELAKAQATFNETRQAVAAKRIDASAEDGGVEGTLKRGKGPIYRQRMAELGELQRKVTITDEPRLKEAQRQRDQASARIVSLKREIATINGEVAKYKGETHTAEQRIKAAQASEQDAEGTRVDPARALPAFERARAAFRQQPDTERLAALQTQCGHLVNAMSGTPTTKEKVRSIDCDPKQAAEAAARVFALNAGVVAFQASCAGGSKLPQNATTDTLLGFGRKCLQDSGLISKESTDLGARLQAIDMNRDDKAHRFVVTWNAFLDGNRLAYLSLVLAIGVDALVFMAGLFGAAAVKSPLSDVPSPKARSAEQLQAVIDTALLPHTYENARLMLNAMRPMAARDGFTQRMMVHDDNPHAPDLHRVLNAGATIGAVRHVEGNLYELRAELFEHLSLVAKKAFAADKGNAALAELERSVAVALLPEVRNNAETVLHYVQPVEDQERLAKKLKPDAHKNFTSEIKLGDMLPQHKEVVRSALNAGATLHAVQRADNNHYYVSRDFYQALTRIRARFLISAGQDISQVASAAQRGAPTRLHEVTPTLPNRRARGLLTNGHRANGTAREAEDEMRGQFRQDLLGALGLPTVVFEEPEVSAEAMMAAAALKRQAREHRALRILLDRGERTSKRALDEAERALADRLDDEQTLQLLGDTRREIGRIVPALMLLPELSLFEDLIEAAGQDELDDDGHLLVNRLRKLKGDIETMNLADSSAWKRITVQIEQLNSRTPLPTHAGDDKLHH